MGKEWKRAIYRFSLKSRSWGRTSRLTCTIFFASDFTTDHTSSSWESQLLWDISTLSVSELSADQLLLSFKNPRARQFSGFTVLMIWQSPTEADSCKPLLIALYLGSLLCNMLWGKGLRLMFNGWESLRLPSCRDAAGASQRWVLQKSQLRPQTDHLSR